MACKKELSVGHTTADTRLCVTEALRTQRSLKNDASSHRHHSWHDVEDAGTELAASEKLSGLLLQHSVMGTARRHGWCEMQDSEKKKNMVLPSYSINA
jgi:hypothetical protein